VLVFLYLQRGYLTVVCAGKALIRQLESDNIDWHGVAEMWARERGQKKEDLAPGILAAASLGGWTGVREPIEPGVVHGAFEKWRCDEQVLLLDWARPRHITFVLPLGEGSFGGVFPVVPAGEDSISTHAVENEGGGYDDDNDPDDGEGFVLGDDEEDASDEGGDPSCNVHSPPLPGALQMNLEHSSPLGGMCFSAPVSRVPSAGQIASPARPHANFSHIDRDSSASDVNHDRVSFPLPGGFSERDPTFFSLGSGPKSSIAASGHHAGHSLPSMPGAMNCSWTCDTRPPACSDGLEGISSSEIWKDAVRQLGLES